MGCFEEQQNAFMKWPILHLYTSDENNVTMDTQLQSWKR